MTVRKEVIFTDDITGSAKDVKTVTFGFEGKAFEIDLSASNRKNLERSLAKYVANARPIKSVKAGKSAKAGKRGPAQSPIRQWAKDNGIAVSERGRISAQVKDAYSTAQSVSV